MTTMRTHLLLIVGGIAGIVVTLFITNTMFDGSMEKMTSTPTWQNVVLVNVLVGACIFLFVVELRRGAIRVLLTVVVSLLLGYPGDLHFQSGFCRALRPRRLPRSSGFRGRSR